MTEDEGTIQSHSFCVGQSRHRSLTQSMVPLLEEVEESVAHRLSGPFVWLEGHNLGMYLGFVR
jgi:hypothetical protein